MLKQIYHRVLPESFRKEIWMFFHKYEPYVDRRLLPLIWLLSPRLLVSALGNRLTGKSICFVPEQPPYPYIMFKFCSLLGLKMAQEPDARTVAAVRWKDITIQPSCPEIEKLDGRMPVINKNCTDISKTTVDRIFEDVFGYSIQIDPLTWKGLCVKKSIGNAAHDGQILTCPLSVRDKGFVYQIVIDNRVDDKTCLELRVAVIGGSIPYVFRKYRHIETRFNKYFKSEFATPGEHFSETEIKNIIAFARRIGMDCGELDVLRDRENGLIYIVDANNTPWSPTRYLSTRDAFATLIRGTKAFSELF